MEAARVGGEVDLPPCTRQEFNICLAMLLENHVLEGNQNSKNPLRSQEKGMGPSGAGEVWLDPQPWVRGKD